MKQTIKRMTALLLAAALITIHLPLGLSAEEKWDGISSAVPQLSGTIYQISSAEELYWFAQKTNEGEALSAELTNDIDLNSQQWSPIGTTSYPFQGEFNGAGFEIHNINFTASSAWSGALFGKNEGVIQNLKVSGSITSSANGMGSIAAWNAGGSIINCESSAELINTKANAENIGGIAGQNSLGGKIINCIFTGSVTAATETSGGKHVGGIAGQNVSSVIAGCVNTGNITGANSLIMSNTGGIAGYWSLSGANSTTAIYNCYNIGEIKSASSNSFTGGIIGAANATSSQYDSAFALLNCYNAGIVNGAVSAGIIAKTPNYGTANFINNYTLAETSDYQNGKVSEADINTDEFISVLNSEDGSGYGITIDENQLYKGSDKYPQLAWQTVSSDNQNYLNQAKQTLIDNYYKITPVYGQDANITAPLKRELESLGYYDIDVSLKQSSDTDYISQNGDITYFYADPNESLLMWFKNVNVTFILSKGGSNVEYTTSAAIYWDQNKAKEVMKREISDNVTEAVVKAENESLGSVCTDLTLPKIVDGKKWALISWKSSNPDIITINNDQESSSGTFYEPFIGKVRQGEQDENVTLTAAFNFQLANTTYGESQIQITKSFDITVKASGSDLSQRMQSLLDTNYTADKLTCSGTSEAIDINNVKTDIQFPSPKNTGIPDYSSYTFKAESSDSNIIQINSYRGIVYRPLPGEDKKQVVLTIYMTHKNFNVTVEKQISVTVAPLTQAEIDGEIELMEAAKASYFNGINNGANTAQNNITSSLTPFQEAYFNEQGNLIWAYSAKETTGTGIIPVSIDENRPSELWDKFQSSAPQVISHETLNLTKPEHNQSVTITSCLSSSVYEKYAVKYPENEDFQKLYRQKVSALLTVIGESGEESEEKEQITVSFTLIGDKAHGSSGHTKYEYWINNVSQTVKNGATAADIFKQVLAANGYTYEGDRYVSAITTPQGVRLGEFTNGPVCGWLYAVNGVIGSSYADEYYLKENDKVVWFFTDDFMSDPRINGLNVDFSQENPPGANSDSDQSAAEKPKNGWINGYYYKNNVVQKNKWISGRKYRTDKNGKMIKNKIVKIGKNRYAFGKSGRIIKNKWIKRNNKKYRAGKKGTLLKNTTVKIGKKRYAFNKNGVLIKNRWFKHNKKWFRANKRGMLFTNRKIKIKNRTYRFNKKSVCINKK